MNQKISNLMQYFGMKSRNYHHSDTPAIYDSEDRLAYYLDFSERAIFDGPLNEEGIPLSAYKGGLITHPIFTILYALGNCEAYRKNKNAAGKERFLKAANWLVSNQDGQGGWKSTVPMSKFGLTAPFYSALFQGMGISVLVRANLLSRNEKYMRAANNALKLYQAEIKDGGVSRVIDGLVFYEEYPSDKNYHVLNGFIYALWGLLDLVRYNNNEPAQQLWEAGLKTLTEVLPQYDTGSWSLYHIGQGIKNPATITYHKIHIEQLKVMHAITGQKIFWDYAAKWESYLDNRFNALKTLPQKLLWNLVRGL